MAERCFAACRSGLEMAMSEVDVIACLRILKNNGNLPGVRYGVYGPSEASDVTQWAANEIIRLRDELASSTRHMELAEAAWLRETSGNSPVAIVLTEDEVAAIENAKTFATNDQTYSVLKKLLERASKPQLR
jgi:hypothetical protein